MKRHTWLLVTEVDVPQLRDHDWIAELRPALNEIAPRDRIAIVTWPARRDSEPILAGTATVAKLDRSVPSLRLRQRVSRVAGHEILVTALGSRLAVARGWTAARRSDLIGAVRAVADRDFRLVEDSLLAAAYEFGPPPRRPAHRSPRTPGRRALIAGQASVRGTVASRR